MPILIFIGLMLALLAFIAWDRHRLTVSKFTPGKKTPYSDPKFLGILGVSLMMAIMAAAQWFQPSLPPFSGKFSYIYSVMHSLMGTHGPAWLFSGLALLFAIQAFAVVQARSREQKG